MTTLSNRTLTGLLWMSAGTGGQLLLQLCVLVVLARLLVPKDFGLVAAAQVMVNLATIFTQLGVGPAIVQRLNLETRHLRVGLTLSCMLGITFTAVIALSAPVISEFFRMPDLVSVVQVMSLAFLLKSLAVVPESLMRRELQFRRLAGIEILALAFGFGAVGIGLAWAGYGVWSLVIAYLAQYATASLMFLVVVPHPKTPSLEMSALRELLGFGGGFTLGRIGNYIAGQGDNLVVGRSLGADALGLYGRAHQLMVAPAALIGLVLDRVLFPAMAKVQSRPDRLGVVYLRGVSLIASVTLPLSVVVVFLAPEVIEVLLGIGWEQVVPPFQVLAIGTLFRTSYKISDSLSRATGAVYRRAWRQGVYAFCVVAGAYFGGKWGLVGVSFGVLLAIAVNFTLMAQLSLRLAHLRWRDFLAAHLSAFPLAAVVAVEAWWIASFLRAEHLSASYTLIITVTVIAFTAVILGVLAKRAFIGQQGLWMLETLAFLVRGKAQGSESG